MRAFHKAWKDKKPYSVPGRGRVQMWTRRVKWYQGPQGEGISIRLVFEDLDEHRKYYQVYIDKDKATKDYEAFIAGASVKSLIEKNSSS